MDLYNLRRSNIFYISFFYLILFFIITLTNQIIVTDTDSLFNHYPNIMNAVASSCQEDLKYSMFGGVSTLNIFHWHTNYFPYSLFCYFPSSNTLDLINLSIILFTYLAHLFLYLVNLEISQNKLFALLISTSFIFSGSYWFLTTSFIAIYQLFLFTLFLFISTRLVYRFKKINLIEIVFYLLLVGIISLLIANSGIITYATGFLCSLIVYLFALCFNKLNKLNIFLFLFISMITMFSFASSSRISNELRIAKSIFSNDKSNLDTKNMVNLVFKDNVKPIDTLFPFLLGSGNILNPFYHGKNFTSSSYLACNLPQTCGNNSQFHTIPYVGFIPLLIICRKKFINIRKLINIKNISLIFLSFVSLISMILFLNPFRISNIFSHYLPFPIHAVIPKLIFIFTMLFIVIFKAEKIAIASSNEEYTIKNFRKLILPSKTYLFINLLSNIGVLSSVIMLILNHREITFSYYFLALASLTSIIIYLSIFTPIEFFIRKIAIKNIFNIYLYTIILSFLLIIIQPDFISSTKYFINIKELLWASFIISILNLFLIRKLVSYDFRKKGI